MGNRIKQLRKESNMTIIELGQITGISPSSLSAYERKQRLPKIEAWQKLADFFNVSVPYIQGYSNDKIVDVVKKTYEKSNSHFTKRAGLHVETSCRCYWHARQHNKQV